MDVTAKLAVLIAERQFIRSQSEPLRERVRDLNRQIDALEGVRMQDIEQQIAALVEVVDLGLDRE